LKQKMGFCSECRTYFPDLREIGLPCPNCGDGFVQVADEPASDKFPLPVVTNSAVMTLREALDLDPIWNQVKADINRMWWQQVENRHFYRGSVERRIDYLRSAKNNGIVNPAINLTMLSGLANTALKLAVGICWAGYGHPFGRYSCKCHSEEHCLPERVRHKCRCSHQQADSLCGTCLLPVDPRGCWLCRTCGGVLVFDKSDWDLPIPRQARQRALRPKSHD